MINSTDTYRLFAKYYDLYAGNYDEDLEFYKSFCKKDDRILEIGCGTGRVLKYFLQSDYYITGVDVSNEMLDIAGEKLKIFLQSKKLVLLNHDFLKNSLKECFDRILITFYTFNYIINNPVIFLKNIYKCLANNGMILIDLFYPKTFLDSSFENKWTTHDLKINNRQINLKDKRWVENNIEHRAQIYNENSKEIKIDTERRYYNPSEIKKYLKLTGFKNILFSLDFNNNSFKKKVNEKYLIKNFIVKAEK